MRCTSCTPKNQNDAQQRFNAFWPAGMQFPPMMPWVGGMFSRRVLRGQYLAAHGGAGGPVAPPVNGSVITMTDIEIDFGSNAPLNGAWAIDIPLDNRNNINSILNQIGDALPQISDDASAYAYTKIWLIILQNQTLSFARIEIIANNGIMTIKIYQTSQLDLIDPTIQTIPQSRYVDPAPGDGSGSGGAGMSSDGSTSGGTGAEGSGSVSGGTGAWLGSEEGWDGEPSYGTSGQSPYTEDDELPVGWNDGKRKKSEGKELMDDEDGDGEPDEIIIDPCRRMPFGCYGLVFEINEFINNIDYSYNYNMYKINIYNQYIYL